MSKYHLKDKNLTYKAKYLFSFMLRLPDMNGLVAISKENISVFLLSFSLAKKWKEYFYFLLGWQATFAALI